MKQKTKKITITVTTQTAYNLKKLSSIAQLSEGRVVDKLVRDRMVSINDLERFLPKN